MPQILKFHLSLILHERITEHSTRDSLKAVEISCKYVTPFIFFTFAQPI